MEAILAASDELNEQLEAFAPHFDPTRYKVLVQRGLLAEADYQQLAEQMRAFMRVPTAIALMINLLVLGTKPPAVQNDRATTDNMSEEARSCRKKK